MSRSTKWVFGVLIGLLIAVIAIGTYFVMSGKLKIGAAGESESCLSVLESASTPSLTNKVGAVVLMHIARRKTCSNENVYSLIEAKDPTALSIETAIPIPLGEVDSQYQSTGLSLRVRLLKTGTSKMSVKLAERQSQNPLELSITATANTGNIYPSTDWTLVANQGVSEIDISGGTAPYKYRTVKYGVTSGVGQFQYSQVDGTFATETDTTYAKVVTVGSILKITGKKETVTVYGEVQDSAGKTTQVRFTVLPSADVSKKTATMAVGKDAVITIPYLRNSMSLSGTKNVSLWKVESQSGSDASTFTYRGLAEGSAQGFVNGFTTNSTGQGDAFWKNFPVTETTITVSGAETTAACTTGKVAYPYTPSAWNIMAMPVTKSGATSISKLLGLDTTNLNTWKFKGLGTNYEKTDTFAAGEGYWFNSSATQPCLTQSDLTTKTEIKLPFKGFNLVTNPNATKSVKLSDIKIKLDSGKEYSLPEALAATEEIGGKKYSVVKMIAFWTPEDKASAQGKYNVYDVYVNKTLYPNYRSDDYSINVHDVSDLPTSLGALKGMWVASRSTSAVTVSYK